MGEKFCSMSGCLLLQDPTCIDFYGTPTLLMHGDLLCTDDHKYMEFRNKVRTRAWQDEFLGKPLQERDHIVRSLRQESKDETANKEQYIMDVNQQAVEAIMQEHGVTQLIHGHTHRPAIHTLGNNHKRIVLGDWHEQGSVLRCAQDGCRLESYVSNSK